MISLSQLQNGPISQENPSQPAMDYSKVSWDQALGTTAQSKPSQVPNTGLDEIKSIPGGIEDAFKNVGNAFSQAGTNTRNILTSNSTPGKIDPTATMLGKAADTAGEMGGAINKSVGGFINPVVKGLGNIFSDIPGMQQLAGGGAGDAVAGMSQKLTQKVNSAIAAHPEIAHKVADAFNVLGGVLALQGNPEDIADTITNTADKAGDLAFDAKNAITGGDKADGEFYHGTSKANADSINANGFKKSPEGGMMPSEIYATSDKSLAQQYASLNKDGGEVVPLKVNTDNVKIFRNQDAYNRALGDQDPQNFNKQWDAVIIKNAAANGGDHVMVNDPNNAVPVSMIKPEPIQASVDTSEKVAADAIKNPLTSKEQQTAFGSGKAKVNGINQKIEYEPDPRTVKMQNALKPLADEGKIVSPKTAEDQISNATNVQEEITSKGEDIRNALKSSKATWNSNELKGNLEDVNIPDPVKNEPAMAKNATSLKNAALKIAQDATKTPDGILDLRQNFDQYIKDNYGQNFFSKGRDADPWHSYVYSLRDTMNDMAGYKLPEGKLPDGTTYGDALKDQSNLISAKEEMAQKFAREYPEASTNMTRFLKAHPLIKRFGLRTALTVGSTILGVSALNAGIKKLESGK